MQIDRSITVLQEGATTPDDFSKLFFNNERAAKYFSTCTSHVDNSGIRSFLASYNGEVPITSYSYDKDHSTYVTTTESHYVDYGWDEVAFHVKNSLIRILAWTVIRFIWALCKISNVNGPDVCFFNNSLISTNLYRDEQDVARNLHRITSELLLDHKMNFCVFRCIDRIGTPNLLRTLESRTDCVLIASRVVNQLHTSDDSIWRKTNSQKDTTIIGKHIGASKAELKEVQQGTKKISEIIKRCRVESTSSTHIMRQLTSNDSVEVYERIRVLYANLYLNKYSPHNPGYTAEFFRSAADIWTIVLLERRDSQVIEGFMCMSEVGDSVSCPALGYDLEASTPSYIILQFWAILEAKSRGKHLNMSGGVTAYKQTRGAIPVLEYSGIWINPQVSWHRRIFWHFMSFATHYIVQPILKRKSIY